MITNTFTAERHFKSLYKNDRERAMINMINHEHDDDNLYEDLPDALANAFDWTESNEGYLFWYEVFTALEHGVYDQLRADQKGSEFMWEDGDEDILKEWAESEPDEQRPLPEDAAERKTYPIYSGFINYFPNAIAAVSHLSYSGSKQHHPDAPVHWDMSKSGDELDAMMRHMIDGDWEQVAWRAMANLERKLTGNCQYED
jgi:hypothetical protein